MKKPVSPEQIEAYDRLLATHPKVERKGKNLHRRPRPVARCQLRVRHVAAAQADQERTVPVAGPETTGPGVAFTVPGPEPRRA